MPRLQTPEPIAALRSRSRGFCLVRGEVLGAPPRGARPVAPMMPYGLGASLGEPEAVAVRLDVDDTHAYRERIRPQPPELYERGRDFLIADASGHALVRLVDERAHLLPYCELRLDQPFVDHELEATVAYNSRTAYLRALRVGEPVYLWGRPVIEDDPTGLGPALGSGGYREAPTITVFSGAEQPLHLFDETAFRSISTWQALPWYRKLSVLVRNR